MTSEEQAQRAAVVAEAQSWIGTPYQHEGRVKGAGVDCAMLIAEVYYQCGLIPYIDPRPYSAQFHLHFAEERYLGFLEEYARLVDSPRPGDLALFKVGLCVSHAGIVVEWPIIIHSYAQAGICLDENISEVAALHKRIHGFLRYNDWEA